MCGGWGVSEGRGVTASWCGHSSISIVMTGRAQTATVHSYGVLMETDGKMNRAMGGDKGLIDREQANYWVLLC